MFWVIILLGYCLSTCGIITYHEAAWLHALCLSWPLTTGKFRDFMSGPQFVSCQILSHTPYPIQPEILQADKSPNCLILVSWSKYIAYLYLSKYISGWRVVWNIFIFPCIGNNHRNWLNWLIFFRGVETTNQIYTVPPKWLVIIFRTLP